MSGVLVKGDGLKAWMMDETALVREAQRGGQIGLDAFNTLVMAYQSQVYNVAYRILGDGAAAADATQEAFISAFKSLPNFRGGSFKSFLLRTVTNACYDALRYAKRRPTTSLDEATGPSSNDPDALSMAERLPANEENPADTMERLDLREHIARAALQLPIDQRIVFVLSDVQGLSYDEIAEVTKASLGTVKSRLSRARAKLRDLLLAQPELLPEALRR